MNSTRKNQQHSLTQRIGIGAYLFFYMLTVLTINLLAVFPKSIYSIIETKKQISIIEEEQFSNEKEVNKIISNDDIPVIQYNTSQSKPVLENLKYNISEWCLEHESDDSITIWKMRDKLGNLIISVKNNKEEVIATFKYEGFDTNHYDDWISCNYFFKEITVNNIIDMSFTAYHEVGGKNPENVQAQVFVLINRYNNEYFSDSIRGVITQPRQYSTSKNVINRFLKSDTTIEREDLEKCFRQVLLVLAGEYEKEVPPNVVYAARGSQGSGVWKVIDKTYYCFL